MFYLSEKDNSIGHSEREVISLHLWEGIRSVIMKYIDQNHLAKDFPILCEDGNNQVYSTNRLRLQSVLNTLVPDAPMLDVEYKPQCLDPFGIDIDEDRVNPFDNPVKRTYIILDVIQFIHNRIYDYRTVDYHAYYKHEHIKFIHKTRFTKGKFVEEINDLFRRNNIIYQLTENGEIIRPVPTELIGVIKGPVSTPDKDLNNLINEAIIRYQSPKAEDRQIAIEKLWDAFERLKTIEYVANVKANKKKLAEEVIHKMSDNDIYFIDLLKDEMLNRLTVFGNDCRIRHHEKNKRDIPNSALMDYLFYRCMILVRLFLEHYNSSSIID